MLKRPTSRKPSIRTAPISVILLVPARAPVVSRSRATKGTSARSGSGVSQWRRATSIVRSCLAVACPAETRSWRTSAARSRRHSGAGAFGEAMSRRTASTASRGSPRTSKVSWSLSATANESCSCIERPARSRRRRVSLKRARLILDNTSTWGPLHGAAHETHSWRVKCWTERRSKRLSLIETPSCSLDRVVELVPGEYAIAEKDILRPRTCSAAIFLDTPSFPGFFSLRLWRRPAPWLCSPSLRTRARSCSSPGADNVRFRRPVLPGDIAAPGDASDQEPGPWARARARRSWAPTWSAAAHSLSLSSSDSRCLLADPLPCWGDLSPSPGWAPTCPRRSSPTTTCRGARHVRRVDKAAYRASESAGWRRRVLVRPISASLRPGRRWLMPDCLPKTSTW